MAGWLLTGIVWLIILFSTLLNTSAKSTSGCIWWISLSCISCRWFVFLRKAKYDLFWNCLWIRQPLVVYRKVTPAIDAFYFVITGFAYAFLSSVWACGLYAFESFSVVRLSISKCLTSCVLRYNSFWHVVVRNSLYC